MCGINGVVDFDVRSSFQNEVARMNDAIEHRGPDGVGEFHDEGISLGHRRLSIIDVDDRSNQPMFSEDGRYVIVFNGEIYNYNEIKSQLNEYNFSTGSDTEVILAAFAKWKMNAIRMFNGMFAFAIWDKEEQSIYLYRDRMGIKPLYYVLNGGRLIFSSSVKAILTSGLVDRKLNRNALIDYLRFQTVHGTNTLIEGIELLEPGHAIKFNADQFQKKQYWSLINDYRTTSGSKDEIYSKVRETLSKSVEKRMISDVPLGAFLSGGIDSSIVVALMAQSSTEKINTFSVAFQEEEFSESKFAQQIAKKYHTEHHEILLKANDFRDKIPEALSFMDHPSADGLNTYIVSEATKKAGITVALSGLGGDELFAGYPVFKRIYDLKSKGWLMSFPPGFRKLGGSVLAGMKRNIAGYKAKEVLGQQYFDVEYIYQFSRQVFLDRDLKSLVKGSLPLNSAFDLLNKSIGFGNNGYNLPPLSRISVAELSTYLHSVLLRDADQMSMAHSLEIRVPFLDHELVEMTLGIPDGHKYPKTQKQLLVNAFKDMLPEEIYNRDKMGFVLPYDHWMKNELRSYCEENLNYLQDVPYINFSEIDKYWQQFLNGNPNYNWARIWGLITLGNWIHSNDVTY